MEKATRAYVSYVRGYKEHHCSYIFRLAVRRGCVFVCSQGLGEEGSQGLGEGWQGLGE
jgi:ATP-dependent RNA helicase DDX55/SPB4